MRKSEKFYRQQVCGLTVRVTANPAELEQIQNFRTDCFREDAKALFVSPSPDTASKRTKGIYETPKKCRAEKTGEISRNLPFSRFSSLGSKLTCHHVMCVRFRCKTVCGQFRCTQILQRVDYPLGDDGSCT